MTSAGDTLLTISLQTGAAQRVAENAGYGRYLESGHIVFVQGGRLMAAVFDVPSLRIQGTPVAIADDLIADLTVAMTLPFSVSTNGMLLYQSGVNNSTWPTVWMDRNGKMTQIGSRTLAISHPRLSPDGKRMAALAATANGFDLWVFDLERDGTPARIVESVSPGELVWTPDGKQIVFASKDGLWVANSDGSGTPYLWLERGRGRRPQSFAPGGRRLVVAVANGGGLMVHVVDIEIGADGKWKAGKAEKLWADDSFQIDGEVSADGRWIAYATNDGRVEQVIVRPFQGNGPKVRVTTGGGKIPRWSKAGRELFYRDSGQRIMVVSYTVSGDTFQPGVPELWSPRAVRRGGVYPNYDVAPDGKRVIAFPAAGESVDGTASAQTTVLVNLFDELKRRTGSSG